MWGEKSAREFRGLLAAGGRLGGFVDVITVPKPSYLVDNLPGSKCYSPHPYLKLSLKPMTFLILCFWL